ncbi:MAG: prepilin-type N-terminal cleavage/methylation domain-containing protein [Planctomycetaceae bacterium]
MKIVARSTSINRGGYTLVEMIIAMVLVSALMSSVWTIMSLYNSLLTAGRDRTTEEQLVRSLFELMHDDLASVNVAEPPPSMMEFGDTLNDTTSGTLSSDAATAEALPTSPFAEQSFTEQRSRVGELFVSGTSTALRLRIRSFEPPDVRPASDIDLLNELGGGSAMQQQDAGNVKEFQTVVYQIIPQDSGGPDETAVAGLVSGLYRIQADTLAMDALEASQSTAELQRQVSATEVSRQNLLLLVQTENDSDTTLDIDPQRDSNRLPQAQIESIPEVIDCRFEYFDGSRWVSSWTDDQLQGMPAAVRISLDVVSQKDLQRRNETYEPAAAELTAATEAVSLGSADDLYSQPIAARRYSRTILLNATAVGVPGGSP